MIIIKYAGEFNGVIEPMKAILSILIL